MRMIEKLLAPVNYERDRNSSCVILGSFKNKSLIDETIDRFTDANIDVLAPPKGRVTQQQGGFNILEGDNLERHHWIELENMFMLAMTSADVLWLVNPDGYVGESTAWELAIAGGYGIPTYSTSRITRCSDDDFEVRMLSVLTDPIERESFIKMVQSRVLDVTNQIGFVPQNERMAPKGYWSLPIRRKPGMRDCDWEAHLRECEIPKRLVKAGDWPFA